MSKAKCDMDCFNCKYADCINHSNTLTYEEYQNARFIENSLVKDQLPRVDMTRYIHNRPDKEVYEKQRNREYEQKRKGSPARKEAKKRQYAKHREAKLAYQKAYYEENREERRTYAKHRYEQNKDRINARRRELYALKKKGEQSSENNQRESTEVA